MRNKEISVRKYTVTVTILFLLATASIILCFNPEGGYRRQLLLLGFMHGAVNRNAKTINLTPSFNDSEPYFLWKIETLSQPPPNPLIAPKPGVSQSDAQTVLHMFSGSTSTQHTYLRIFQFGYWIGWNWLGCLMLSLALIGVGIFYRHRLCSGESRRCMSNGKRRRV